MVHAQHLWRGGTRWQQVTGVGRGCSTRGSRGGLGAPAPAAPSAAGPPDPPPNTQAPFVGPPGARLEFGPRCVPRLGWLLGARLQRGGSNVMSTSRSKMLPKSIFVGVRNISLWPGEGRARVCLALCVAAGEEELALSPCPLPTLSWLGAGALQERRVWQGSARSWVPHGKAQLLPRLRSCLHSGSNSVLPRDVQILKFKDKSALTGVNSLTCCAETESKSLGAPGARRLLLQALGQVQGTRMGGRL